MFDVALDHETKRPRTDKTTGAKGKGDKPKPNYKRQGKNEKYGFGGKKKWKKSGDAMSTSDMSGFSTKRMKGKASGAKTRPGKARRAKARS